MSLPSYIFMKMQEVYFYYQHYIKPIKKDIGTRVFFMEYYYNTLHVNIAIIAYRGYSDSTGYPTEKGLMLDAE